MSTKPTTTPRWAGVSGAIVEPTSGEKDVGWIDGDPAPAEYMNWLNDLADQWFVWLDDGDVSFNDVDIAGELNVTGDVNIIDDLDVNGSSVLQDVTATGIVVAGDVQATHVKWTSGMGMRVPAAAAIMVGTGYTFTVIGAGEYVWSLASGSSPNALVYPISIDEGDRITGWAMFVNKASASGTISGAMYRLDGLTGVATPVGVGAGTGPGATGRVSFGDGALTSDVGADDSYFVVIFGGGTPGDYAYHLEVFHSRP